MSTFYVYQINFSNGNFYVGYRGTNLEPEKDLLIRYKTSSKVVKKLLKENILSVTYHILYRNLSKEEAYDIEQEIIFRYFNSPYCLNQRCYHGKEKFGIITEEAKKTISEKSKKMWSDENFREKMIVKQKESWTVERKENQVKRLLGKKRPEHSEKMKDRKLDDETKTKLKKINHTEEWNEKVSNSLKGMKKTEEHKKKLSKPKPKVVCRLSDRKLMALGNFMRWIDLC